MFPELEYVLKKRYQLNVILRCAAVVLIVLGAIPFAQLVGQLVLALLYSQFSTRPIRSGVDWPEFLIGGVPEMLKYVVPGLLLIWLGPRIVRWLTPLPKPRCPECGYWIKRGGAAQCPECGSPLPRVLVERGGTPAAGD